MEAVGLDSAYEKKNNPAATGRAGPGRRLLRLAPSKSVHLFVCDLVDIAMDRMHAQEQRASTSARPQEEVVRVEMMIEQS
jgi:hypothetical protein